MAATATALVDVTVLGETFVITVDRNHGTVDALAEEAYEQYHACYPDEPVQAILFIRDAAGRIVNGKLRVLDLTGHSHGHGPGPGQSSLNRFEVVVGQRKHAAPSSSSSSSSSRTGRADPHAPHDDGPDEQLVEVKVYEETFLIAADRDTTVTALATKAYEEYRMSYPEAVMKRILLVRDEAGRVVSGNLRVLRLGSSNSNSSGGGGGGGRRFDVEVDEHPWTEEVLAVDDIDAAYRNWQLTTARSVASMIYHLCTAPLDAPSPDALPAAPSLSRAAAAAAVAAATKPGAAMGTDENVSRVRAALDLVAELQASTSQPVQLSCLESLRLLLMLHDDLSVVDAAFHLLRRAFMDAVRVETAIAALRALRDAIETTAVVLSKETIAALDIDVARSKFPAHRAELSRLFGFLMMRAPVDASAAVSRPASRMAGAGAGLSKQSSVDTMMTLTSVAGRTEATMLYDTNRALQPSMPLQPEFLAPEFRNRTKMLPAGGPGGARADADATAQSVGRLVALLSSPTPSLRRSALRKLRRALSALAGAARAKPYFADTAGDGDDDTYAFTAATQFQFEDVALTLRSEAGLAAVASCLLRGLKHSLHTPGKRPPPPQEGGSPGSGAFPRLEGAYDVGGPLRATEGGPLPPPQPWLGVDRGAPDPWGGGEPPTRRTFLQAHSKAARLVEATVASPLTDGESAHLALVCVWQLHRLAAGGAAAGAEAWPGGAGRGLSEAFPEAKDGGEGLLLPGPGPRPGPGPGGGRGRGKGSAVLDACADHARLLLTLAHVEPAPADAYAHGGGGGWGAGSPLRGDAGDAGERPTLACLGGALVRVLARARGGWAHAAAPGGPPLRLEDHAVRCFLLDYLRALVGPGPASEPHSAALTASAAYPHAFPTGTVQATRGALFGPPGGAGAFTVAGVGAAAVPPACAERAALALLYLQHLAEGAGAGAGGEQQHPRQSRGRGPGTGTGASAGTLSMAGQYSGVEALVTLDSCQVPMLFSCCVPLPLALPRLNLSPLALSLT